MVRQFAIGISALAAAVMVAPSAQAESVRECMNKKKSPSSQSLVTYCTQQHDQEGSEESLERAGTDAAPTARNTQSQDLSVGSEPRPETQSLPSERETQSELESQSVEQPATESVPTENETPSSRMKQAPEGSDRQSEAPVAEDNSQETFGALPRTQSAPETSHERDVDSVESQPNVEGHSGQSQPVEPEGASETKESSEVPLSQTETPNVSGGQTNGVNVPSQDPNETAGEKEPAPDKERDISTPETPVTEERESTTPDSREQQASGAGSDSQSEQPDMEIHSEETFDALSGEQSVTDTPQKEPPENASSASDEAKVESEASASSSSTVEPSQPSPDQNPVSRNETPLRDITKLDLKEQPTTEERSNTPNSAEQSTVGNKDPPEESSDQPSEQYIQRYCGLENVKSGNGSREVYENCKERLENTTSSSDASSKEEQSEDLDRGVLDVLSETQPSPSSPEHPEEENAPASETSPSENPEQPSRSDDESTKEPQNTRNGASEGQNPSQRQSQQVSVQEFLRMDLYEFMQYCEVRTEAGLSKEDAVKEVQRQVTRCHARFRKRVGKQYRSRILKMQRRMLQQIEERRPTMRMNANAQMEPDGDVRGQVNLTDQRFSAHARYSPSSTQSLDVAASHRLTGEDADIPVSVGGGLKNIDGKTHIGPRVNVGPAHVQLGVVNGHGVSFGINLLQIQY